MLRTISLAVSLAFLAAGICSVGQTHADPSALRSSALTLEQQGKNQEATEAWRSLSARFPGDPEPYAHLGLLEARQGHDLQAVPYYRKALALGPKLPSVELNLGLALFKGGDLKQAIEVLGPLHKQLPPASPQARQTTLLLGMAHYGLAEYADAAPYLKEAVAGNPGSLPLLLALAHSYLWSSQFQKVLDVYHQILSINPDSAEADMLAGEALDQMKDNDGAMRMFRAAVKADPKEPSVHFGLGYLLWTQKQYPEAASEFRAELANDPNHAQATLYLADSELQMNHPEVARPLLEKAEKLDPALPLTHLDLGILLTEAGDQTSALRELEEAKKLNPDDVDVHWRLGRLYRAMGDKERAKAELEKASQLNKAADESLYKKIAAGAARGHQVDASSNAQSTESQDVPAKPAATQP